MTITATGAGSGATATAFGGVNTVNLSDAGSGYTMPTVSFDLPDDPNGIQAAGHVTCVEADCQPANPGDAVTLTGVVVDEPGSGYATAPGVAILNGTQFAPMDLNTGGHFAVAAATLTIDIDPGGDARLRLLAGAGRGHRRPERGRDRSDGDRGGQ